MKRIKIEKLPIQLLDRLAEYSKMDWWFEETYYKHREIVYDNGIYINTTKKTVTLSQLKDLFCGFTLGNLARFKNTEKVELYRCMVKLGLDDKYYTGALIESIRTQK